MAKYTKSQDHIRGRQVANGKNFDASGAVHLSHNILRRQLTSFRRVAPTGDAKFAWEVVPEALKGLMGDAAKQAGILKFARSITREESGFIPD